MNYCKAQSTVLKNLIDFTRFMSYLYHISIIFINILHVPHWSLRLPTGPLQGGPQSVPEALAMWEALEKSSQFERQPSKCCKCNSNMQNVSEQMSLQGTWHMLIEFVPQKVWYLVGCDTCTTWDHWGSWGEVLWLDGDSICYFLSPMSYGTSFAS